MDNTNVDRRFHFGWALEAAEVRRDQWKVRSEENIGEEGEIFSERLDKLNNSLYEESQHNAAGISEGIGKGIEVARTMVNATDKLVEMRGWEVGMHEGEFHSEGAGTRDWLKEGEGAYQARDNALLIAKVFMRASDWAYRNGFDDSEDWEFIPSMLPEIQRMEKDPTKVTSYLCMKAAEKIVRLYLEEQS